jgi:hypothetical protein
MNMADEHYPTGKTGGIANLFENNTSKNSMYQENPKRELTSPTNAKPSKVGVEPNKGRTTNPLLFPVAHDSPQNTSGNEVFELQ